MLYLLSSMIGGLCFLFCYRLGLRDGGKQITKINPVISAVKTIDEIKQATKNSVNNDKFYEGLTNILNYDGTPQKAVNE